MKQIYLLFAVLTITVTVSGCSSLESHIEGKPKGPYPGVRVWPETSKEMLSVSHDGTDLFTHFGPVAFPFVLMDLPMSFAMDTFYVPFDIAKLVKQGAKP
jgi:uncharacterized protein YceK